MRHGTLTALIFLASLVLTQRMAVGQAVLPGATKTWSGAGCSFGYPDVWTLLSPAEVAAVEAAFRNAIKLPDDERPVLRFMLSRPCGRGTATINLVIANERIDFRTRDVQRLQDSLSMIDRFFAARTSVSETRFVRLRNSDVLDTEFAINANGTRIVGRQVAVPTADGTLILSLTGPKLDYPEVSAEFDALLRTLSIDRPVSAFSFDILHIGGLSERDSLYVLSAVGVLVVLSLFAVLFKGSRTVTRVGITRDRRGDGNVTVSAGAAASSPGATMRPL